MECQLFVSGRKKRNSPRALFQDQSMPELPSTPTSLHFEADLKDQDYGLKASMRIEGILPPVKLLTLSSIH